MIFISPVFAYVGKYIYGKTVKSHWSLKCNINAYD